MQNGFAQADFPVAPSLMPDASDFGLGIDAAAAACLGSGLSEEAERHLRRAGLSYHRDEEALAHLQAAWQAAPGHAAVYIGLYRFYFYKNRLQEALEVARDCLKKAALDNGLPEDWRAAKATDADFGSFEAILPRFFLFTLKGYGYLNLRLGQLDEGRAAIEKLVELDPGDKLGGKVLLSVLERQADGEDD
jgi:tetratricopeptide (TPR) repeat protein